MKRFWRSVESALSWVLFVRMTLLVAVVFVAFPFLATGPLQSLLGGTFVLGFRGLIGVTLLALAVGRALILVCDTASRSGPMRLLPRRVEGGEMAERPYSEQRSVGIARSWNPDGTAAHLLRTCWSEWIGIALALPTVLVAFLESREPDPGREDSWVTWKLVAVVLGFVFYALLRVGTDLLERGLAPPELEEKDPECRPLAALQRWSSGKEPGRLAHWFRGRIIWLFTRATFGAGYVRPRTEAELTRAKERRESGGKRASARSPAADPAARYELLPGHASALSFFLMVLGVYVVLGSFNYLRGFRSQTPTLIYVLLILMMASWVLHALSFWLDRFRVPVLLALVAWSYVMYSVGGSDHYFRLVDAPSKAAPAGSPPPRDTVFSSDEALLRSRIVERCGQPVVAVAAAGGGITSAAWTTAVLTRLAEDPATGGRFLDSLQLVSGVSGGSVGSMFFLDGIPPLGGAPRHGALAPETGLAIRRAASSSSLEAVGWGLAYPDLARVVLTPLVTWVSPWIDRSWALEKSWAARLVSTAAGGGAAPPTLAQWREDFLRGDKPAMIFNATAVETGERFQLATLRSNHRTKGVVEFSDAYPGYDVAIPTAARLSATFPLVSTAARARAGRGVVRPEAHYVDGGYYDNSGLLSVLEVLDGTLSDLRKQTSCRPAVAIVLLQAFEPDPTSVEQVEAGSGWLTSGLSPLQTLIAVRTSTQSYRNQWELGVFAAKWSRDFEIVQIPIGLGGLGPLSWRLTAGEIERIDSVALGAMGLEEVIGFQRLLEGRRRAAPEPREIEMRETVVQPLKQAPPAPRPPRVELPGQ